MKKKSSDYNVTRANGEQSEGFETSTVPAPASRFQTSQQAPSMVESSSKPEVETFVKKKVKSAGPTLRQEVVAEALGTKGVGGGAADGASAAAYGLRVMSFSGDAGSILGNASGTPAMRTEYQGTTRIDKRLSDANKDINFNASEQIMVEYDNIPPLAASESTVGYNGNPMNIAARSQKKTGYTPSEILYDRSLDFVEKDNFVFSTGQVVTQADVDYSAYPTKSYDEDLNETAIEIARGNFSPRAINVKLKKVNGHGIVSSFSVEEDDLSCNGETDQTVNAAATNHMIDLNKAELARQTIDANEGSPSMPHFNPLGRSVAQPTATVTYLQDLENVCGAEIYASYKFANKARAHFLSRTVKDGQQLVSPAIDALYGHLCGALDSDEIKTVFNDLSDGIFSTKGMKAGSAAILIPLFDSKGKYKTKGDLVNQPRGFKLHIQTADNNMDPFRCKKEFVAALNSIDAYSTIDHEYDPTAPVYITDNVRLIHPYSWAEALSFTRDNNGIKTYNSVAKRYYYNAGAGQNRYLVTMGDPLLNGIAHFMDLHANELAIQLFGDTWKTAGNGEEVEWTIPVVHSTTHFSLWDLLVCAATPYIIWERTNTMKDILDYEMYHEYPLLGNVRIKEANPLNAVNYGTIDPYKQMTTKVMLPSSSIRWKYPELFMTIGEDVMLPWYMNERSFSISGELTKSVLTPNFKAEFTTPVVRSGVKLAGLDDFFGMEVKDQLLVTDAIVRVPGNKTGAAFSGYIYKYDQQSDGIPVLRSDYVATLTAKDVYSTPRLLGWYFDAPAGTCSVIARQGLTPTVGKLLAMDQITLADMNASYRAIQYKGVYSSNETIIDRPLDVGSVNVNRAQSFAQVWGMERAGLAVKSVYFDLVLSLNEALRFNDEATTDPRVITLSDKSQFSPFVFGSYAVTGTGSNRHTSNTAYSINVADRPILFAPHLMMWTLIQKLPFVINPFENIDVTKPVADPFGIAYIFGLAGFMAANYDEELYNRANTFQTQGYGYISDPMTAASPVFKDSYIHTQIG